MVLYVLMAALGSVAGAFLVDLVMRKIWGKGLEKLVKPDKIRQLRSGLEKNTGWTLFIVSLLPPPFPYTAVMLTAQPCKARGRECSGPSFAAG